MEEITAELNRYALYDHLNTGIIVIDRDFSVLFWNTAIERLTGIERNRAIAADLRVLIPSVENNLFRAKIETLFRGRDCIELSSGPNEQYIPVLTADGKLIDKRVFLSVVTGFENRGENIIFEFTNERTARDSFSDIGTVKQMLKEETAGLVNTRYKLEKVAEARGKAEQKLATYAIDLEKTNRKLDNSRKELEELIYTASHDLKTPIVSIHGFARLLRERLADMLDEKTDDYLERIMQSTVKMETLLADIMELSRIRNVEVVSEEIDMNLLMEKIVAGLESHAREHGVRIIRPGKLPEVFGQRERVSDLFIRIIENAIRYMPDREVPYVEIGYTTEVIVREDVKGAFYVRDNGEGVPHEYQERIFEMFQRAPARSGTSDGTGAGLTLARKIVEIHGGEMWLESIPGTGSTFYFTLPVKERRYRGRKLSERPAETGWIEKGHDEN